jgi:hypothetical protein
MRIKEVNSKKKKKLLKKISTKRKKEVMKNDSLDHRSTDIQEQSCEELNL